MIRSDDDPATEAVAQVDDAGTADEADDVRQRCPERQDEDLKMGRPHSAQSTGEAPPESAGRRRRRRSGPTLYFLK